MHQSIFVISKEKNLATLKMVSNDLPHAYVNVKTRVTIICVRFNVVTLCVFLCLVNRVTV